MESSVYSRGCTELLLNTFKSSLIYISILAFAIGISEVSLPAYNHYERKHTDDHTLQS